MTVSQLDPAAVKAEQRASWDAISTGWTDALAIFERGAATTTAELIALAAIAPGDAVLDVATGLGEPALTVAEHVGASGTVVGTDISPAMLEAARRRAGGVPNARFVVADVESIDMPPQSFDAAVSRFGLMFAVDHVAAFRTVARLLKPGATLAAAVWAEPARVPMLALGFAVMSQLLALPPMPPTAPGPFGMADPEKLVEELRAAGFTDASVEQTQVPFSVHSPQEYADFNRLVCPPRLLARVAEEFGDESDPRFWGPVGQAVADRRRDDGSYPLGSTALLIRGVVPR